jgi:nucleotide-binding universal stress UspA family protein
MDKSDTRPIVVGVDGSPASRAALRWAVAEAELRQCPVDVILGWHKDFDTAISALPIGAFREPTTQHLREEERRTLDEVVAEVPTSIEVRALLVPQDARTALVEASKQAMLLVIGTRGAGPVSSALFGSVSAHCVRHAACPVVVLHDPDRQPEIPTQATGPAAALTPGPLL